MKLRSLGIVLALLGATAASAIYRGRAAASGNRATTIEISMPTEPAPAPARGLTPFAGDDTADLARLRAELDAALSNGSYGRADWGVLVYSLDHGDTLYARNADSALAPASNMKVVTSVAALHYLGPDFRFQTWLLSDAEVINGVLMGDAVLYGTGDPGIGDRYYRDRATPWRVLVEQLQAAGITEIRGRILGDGSFFTGPMVLVDDWEEEDLNEWYGAASGALSYNENVASLRIEPSAPGRPPSSIRFPTTPVRR